uniref:Uncharacterized protein n=1 Tax=Oryza barthii TaxID=65489 RepID=A0A0D3G1M0_9ORYZ
MDRPDDGMGFAAAFAERGRACVRAAHITPAAWRWTDRLGWGGGRRIRDLVYAGTRGDLQTPVVPISIPLQADLVYLVRERKADKNVALRASVQKQPQIVYKVQILLLDRQL